MMVRPSPASHCPSPTLLQVQAWSFAPCAALAHCALPPAQVADYSQLAKVLTEGLVEYNETNAVMDLVLFEDAMKHVARWVWRGPGAG
jgi:hypothetical protein